VYEIKQEYHAKISVLEEQLQQTKNSDISARKQINELRHAFEKAAVTTAEAKAVAQTSKKERDTMANHITELATLASDQREAIKKIRNARDKLRDHCTATERRLEQIQNQLNSFLLDKDKDTAQMKNQLLQIDDAHLAANAACTAALADARLNTRRAHLATDAAETAKHEVARQASLVEQLELQFKHSESKYREARRQAADAHSVATALAEERRLLSNDLEAAEARLKAQMNLESHLRSVVNELRRGSFDQNHHHNSSTIFSAPSPLNNKPPITTTEHNQLETLRAVEADLLDLRQLLDEQQIDDQHPSLRKHAVAEYDYSFRRDDHSDVEATNQEEDQDDDHSNISVAEQEEAGIYQE